MSNDFKGGGSKNLLAYWGSPTLFQKCVHNAFFSQTCVISAFYKRYSVMDPAIPGLCVNVFCRPFFAQRYGALFTRKRFGVMGALKKALWRYNGHPAKIFDSL